MQKQIFTLYLKVKICKDLISCGSCSSLWTRTYSKPNTIVLLLMKPFCQASRRQMIYFLFLFLSLQ